MVESDWPFDNAEFELLILRILKAIDDALDRPHDEKNIHL